MSSQSLNQSKFLSEQINNQQDPTEQQIIEKAEELGISDLGLAKEALTKQLDPQWKPYMNRRGEVYYINLQERKAYTDHPVDMEITITDALRLKKKVPSYREYSIEEVSRSPRLIQQEISRYQREKGLNVVYEESDEESMRRDTVQSVEEPMGQSQMVELDRNELETYRIELERQMRVQLEAYRAKKEQQYTTRVKTSKEIVEQAKRARLNQVSLVTEQQIASKNELAYQKAVQTTKDQLSLKKERLEDLYSKEEELAYSLAGSQVNRQAEVKTFYRKNRFFNKQKQLRKAQIDTHNSRITKARQQVQLSSQQFAEQLTRIISAKVNLRERINANLQRLHIQPSRSKELKKRYSIFNPDLFCPEKTTETASTSLHSLTDRLNINEPIHNHLSFRPCEPYPIRTAPSLFLRLSLRTL